MCGTWIISKKFNTSRTVLVKYEMRKVLQLEKWKSFQPELNNLQCEMSSGFGESFCLTKCEHVLMNIRSYSRCSDQNTACLIIKQNVAYNVYTPWYKSKAMMRHMRINFKLIHTWARRLAGIAVSVCRQTFCGVLLLWL